MEKKEKSTIETLIDMKVGDVVCFPIAKSDYVRQSISSRLKLRDEYYERKYATKLQMEQRTIMVTREK